MALREEPRIELDFSLNSQRPNGKMRATVCIGCISGSWYGYAIFYVYNGSARPRPCASSCSSSPQVVYPVFSSCLVDCICHLGPLGASTWRSISQSTNYKPQEHSTCPSTTTCSKQLKSRVGPKSHDCSRVTRYKQISFLFWFVIIQLCVCTRAAAVDARVAPIVHQGAGVSGFVWAKQMDIPRTILQCVQSFHQPAKPQHATSKPSS